MILSRPRHFDVDAHHKGKDNVYILFEDEQKLELRPLQEETFQTPAHSVSKQVLLTTGLKFLEDVREAREIIALEKFQNIMADEMLYELPPIRDIQHYIDMVSGVSLPNISHYWMRPKENDIL